MNLVSATTHSIHYGSKLKRELIVETRLQRPVQFTLDLMAFNASTWDSLPENTTHKRKLDLLGYLLCARIDRLTSELDLVLLFLDIIFIENFL